MARSQPPSDKPDKSHLSRRGFIAAAGAGTAGAVALGPMAAAHATHGGGGGSSAVPADRFGRMFPALPAFANPSNQLRAALMDIGKPGGILDAKDALERGPIDLIVDPTLSANNRNNEFESAGVTFFGQFLDHDMTFDTTSVLGQPTPPETSPNVRTPSFDLDTVYGGGPVVSPHLYQADRIKLRVESNGVFEDLPRDANRNAIIGDPRNDENLMIAGLQVAFLKFHNNVVDRLRSQGVPTSQLFAQARRTVTWHYQWIIIKEFLPAVCGFGIVQDVLAFGRKWYRPEPGPAFIPVEFQGACYRFGHTQIRPSYRANRFIAPGGQPFFGMIFDPAGEGQADPVDLRGGARAPRRFIGWETFFNFGGQQTQHMRPNKRIDRKVSTPLFNLPLATIPDGTAPTSLPQRNLLRHVTWSLPSGQRVAAAMGIPTLDPGQLPELAAYGLGLENNTPLWYYTLAESELISDGVQLGPMSARLIAEVFVGLLQLDPNSFLRVQPNWRPTLPSRTAGDFKIIDYLTFAGVDPTSRGH